MRVVAYADPPYIGQAERHYGMPEVDHEALIAEMCQEYDSWALSCSSPSLKQILGFCPEDDIRVGAWVKPFCFWKPGVNPAYAWEPVVLWRGRNRGRKVDTVRDWVAANACQGKGLAGAKPREFCFWLFDFMGLEAGDRLVDLFPGTGIVGRCFAEWCDGGVA